MSSATPHPARLDAHAKALAINLDPRIYGSIAEIGAGQEVARWFLTVGAASGTIAQTISAYDKTFSDVTYGAGTRYVSKERLIAMLDHEYRLLVERLGSTRGDTTRFFAFADTASARNFRGDNEQHAWVGIRFQSEPRVEPSDVLLHVNLMSPTAILQQQALGVLGANLIHAAHYKSTTADDFLAGLWDDLSLDQLEIEVLELRGPAFSGVDARTCCVQLVRRDMTHAVLFDATGQPVEPAGLLRKRPVLIDRGRFAAIEPFQHAILKSSEQHLKAEGIPLSRDPVGMRELSLHSLWGSPPDDSEVVARLERLARLGPVLLSNYGRAHLLAEYVRRLTAEPIRFVLSVSLLARILEDQFAGDDAGGLFQDLGKLLAANVKIYAFSVPVHDVRNALGPTGVTFRLTASDSGLVAADDLHPGPPVEHLYRYLREAGWVVPIEANAANNTPTPGER
jgi:hypothetical protein